MASRKKQIEYLDQLCNLFDLYEHQPGFREETLKELEKELSRANDVFRKDALEIVELMKQGSALSRIGTSLNLAKERGFSSFERYCFKVLIPISQVTRESTAIQLMELGSEMASAFDEALDEDYRLKEAARKTKKSIGKSWTLLTP